MQSLLYGWGLEILSERFAANLIEARLLEDMHEDDIKELCAGFPMRYRIILRRKIRDKVRKFGCLSMTVCRLKMLIILICHRAGSVSAMNL